MRMLFRPLLAAAMLLTPYAHAGFTQRAIEAEQASGGTNELDPEASDGKAVIRSTDGIYAWWVRETTDLTPGSYSVYARIALGNGVSTARNFTPHFYYGSTQIGLQNIAVANKKYGWLRVSSIDLPQVGAQLRISDWSNAGLRLDKLAIIKDVQLEAETTYNVPAVSDSSASGGRAVARTNDGIYTYLGVPAAELASGDYEVYVRLRSRDGVAHTYTSHVTLDNTSLPTVSKSVSSTTYQWVKFNEFTYAGGGQTVLLSDYSQANLVVDAVRLVRRTPYDENTGLQALFAAGGVALEAPEEVSFAGMQKVGRVSMVQEGSKIYAYFRQAPFGTEDYEIYMAESSDRGKTFTLKNTARIIPRGLGAAVLDPHVTKRSDGNYYMFFEAWAYAGCDVASVFAQAGKPDDVTGAQTWVVKNTVVCDKMGPAGSASVPNYFVDVQTGTQYLQWASVNDDNFNTRRYQATLPSSPSQYQLTLTSNNQLLPYALPTGAPGSWESANNSAGDVFYEDGYYYQVFDGANYFRCTCVANGPSCDANTIKWAFGVARTTTPSVLNSWTRSTKNAFMTAGNSGSCWLEYPSIVPLPQGLYLYCTDYTHWTPQNNLSIYRRKLRLPSLP